MMRAAQPDRLITLPAFVVSEMLRVIVFWLPPTPLTPRHRPYPTAHSMMSPLLHMADNGSKPGIAGLPFPKGARDYKLLNIKMWRVDVDARADLVR